MADPDALRTRFARALEGARGPETAGPDPAPYADNLLARWQEPQRHYHTLTHLTAVLDHVDVLEEHATDPDLVRLAAWFHDAVYLPDRSENEERSARLAERALPEAGLSAARTAEVARLVRLTVTHDPAEDRRAPVRVRRLHGRRPRGVRLRPPGRLPGGPRGGPAPTPGAPQAVQDAVRSRGMGGDGALQPRGGTGTAGNRAKK
jgi:hypothetical protein